MVPVKKSSMWLNGELSFLSTVSTWGSPLADT